MFRRARRRSKALRTTAATTTSAAPTSAGSSFPATSRWFPTSGARARATPISTRATSTRNTQLLRRPRDKGALSLIYDGIAKLEIEGRLTLVGSRLDYNYPANVTLAPYAKLDVLANYKVDDNLAMFGRIENLTDARYEEVYNYGVAGRSYYAGISYSW